MTKTKSTKRALLTSALALLMCISMLVGTTFAWFTDSVSSTNNIIKSGNLDVELEYLNGDSWEKVTATTNVFEKDTLWEPGHTEVVYLKVSNLGTLALKYNLGINIVNEIESVNVYDEKLRLSEYIEFGAIEDVDTPYADRDTARDAVTTAKTLSTGYTKAGEIEAGAASDYVALVVYMPETVGNEANYKTGEVAPQIDLGINLMATQYTSEEDSFNNKYDENALFNSLPVARVTKLAKLPTLNTLGGHDVTLDVGYVFETVEDEAAAQKNDRRYWHADFVATLDKDTHTSDLGLWGKYAGYDFAFELDLLQNTTIPANTPVRMLELYNGYMNYEELCRDVKEFSCGAFAVDQAAMDGVTMTVELRLYETTIDPNANSGSANIETGEYVVINKYSYTFGAKKVADAAALKDAIEKGGEIVLTEDVELNETLTVENDVTIDANGNTIKFTSGSSTRFIDVPSTANGANLTIKNAIIDIDGSYCERGINYNTSGTLTLDNVILTGPTKATYGINLPSGSTGARVEMTNCDITALIALNVWGENAVVNVNDCDLSNYDNNVVEGYCTVCLNNNGSAAAEGAVITITGGSITSRDENGDLYEAVRNNTATGSVVISNTTTVNGDIVSDVAVIRYRDGNGNLYDSFYGATTLQEAVTKAAESTNSEIVLLVDITVDTLNVPANLTIYKNGKQLNIGTTTGAGILTIVD